MPIVLVVYDGRKDIAYWIYIQSYFNQLSGFQLFAAGKTVTVRVPITNFVHTAAIRKFSRFRERVVQQMEGFFMAKIKSIAFGEFRRLLNRLGYTDKRTEKFWIFHHPPARYSGIPALYQRMSLWIRDLLVTRRFLDGRGLPGQRRF